MIMLKQRLFTTNPLNTVVDAAKEKEFGLASDLVKYRKSGIKRVLKKNIGETRRKLADKAIEKSRTSEATYKKATKELKRTGEKILKNKETKAEYNKFKNYIKHNKNIAVLDKNGTKFLNKEIKDNTACTNADPKSSIEKIRNKIKLIEGKGKKIKKQFRSDPSNKAAYHSIKYGERKDGVILLGEKYPSMLGHESGHNTNSHTNRRVWKRRQKLSANQEKSILSQIRADRAILKEEIEASKHGLKEMESVLGRKATETEKAALNIAADTHKYNQKAKLWGRVADKINIPSRKKGSGAQFATRTVKEQRAMKNRRERPGIQLPEIKDYKPTQYIK